MDLSISEKSSIIYHNIFDYPLDFFDLIRWPMGKSLDNRLIKNAEFVYKNGFYFLEGREGLIYKRILKKRISAKKTKIAKKVAKLLSFVPGVNMLAITGSLAMENSSDKSDIDLMVIVKRGHLWTIRMAVYLIFTLFCVPVRRPNDSNQKDKLCLNIWLDESDLIWPKNDRNLYTAHEIAQTIPLINKNKTYEKYLYKNRWVLDYWPSAVKVKNLKLKIKNSRARMGLLEQFAFLIQSEYMKPRITRESISPTHAIFHPQDWGRIVEQKLRLT